MSRMYLFAHAGICLGMLVFGYLMQDAVPCSR